MVFPERTTTRSHTKVWLPCGLILQVTRSIQQIPISLQILIFFLKCYMYSHQGLQKCPTIPTPEVLKPLRKNLGGLQLQKRHNLSCKIPPQFSCNGPYGEWGNMHTVGFKKKGSTNLKHLGEAVPVFADVVPHRTHERQAPGTRHLAERTHHVVSHVTGSAALPRRRTIGTRSFLFFLRVRKSRNIRWECLCRIDHSEKSSDNIHVSPSWWQQNRGLKWEDLASWWKDRLYNGLRLIIKSYFQLKSNCISSWFSHFTDVEEWFGVKYCQSQKMTKMVKNPKGRNFLGSPGDIFVSKSQ